MRFHLRARARRRASIALSCLLATACAVSTHEAESSPLGTARSSDTLLASLDQPGPILVETITSADWAVDRAGAINFDHPAAKEAALADGEEPIQIHFHALRHPQHGLFLIDTGVEDALRDAPDEALLRGLVAKAMNGDRMRPRATLGAWLRAHSEPLRGVFLTHLHLDHVLGLPDVPNTTPIYTGPGEVGARALKNAFVQGPLDRALEGKPPVYEWAFQREAAGPFLGANDVFGDGTLWALWTPGHTAGSTSFLARTPQGPVLFTGDTCITRWGWDHGVEPGAFSSDRAQNADSLARLRKLAAAHPKLEVRLGHQR